MTEAEFYAELARINGRGFRARIKTVRMVVLVAFGDCEYEHESWFCPITAVCLALHGKRFSYGSPFSAARVLGLDEDLTRKLVDASDGLKNHDPDTRSRLLTTLNLTDPTA